MDLPALIAKHPPVADLAAAREHAWFNRGLQAASHALPRTGIDPGDIDAAALRLQRFAPCIAQAFPETAGAGGLIESPLQPAPALQRALERYQGAALPGALWLKLDSHLPIAGSIKARGGVHEVLEHVEAVAMGAGLLARDDDYRKLDTPALRSFLSGRRIVVGSTGNLGLAIGITAARFGLGVTVHMSADARAWKKARLRAVGTEVVEHAGDYSAAVAQGRAQAARDAATHFVDDENSLSLFLGYAVAGRRLQAQLLAQGVHIGPDRPLFVYLPCGVGGAPGGVALGLKTVFGNHVHCLFAEPVQAPCMYLGVCTGLHDGISVRDIGLSGATVADGLAVARPSALVGRSMAPLISGFFTISDDELWRLQALLHASEGIAVEPSAVAGLPGPWWVAAAGAYRERTGLDHAAWGRAIHIAWLTGGSMVPEAQMQADLQQGRALLTGGAQPA